MAESWKSNTGAQGEDVTPDEARSRHSSVQGPYRQNFPPNQFPVYYPITTSSYQAAIHCRSLMSSGNGFPPWRVVPSTRPEAHFHKGVGIGDVGYIDGDGGFQYRFNIFYPPSHPIQRVSLPRNFSPIQPPLSEWEIKLSPGHFQPGTVLVSEGIDVLQISESPLEVEFSSYARQGGVLILPEGASREDLVDTNGLYSYIQAHASDWYEYMNAYSDIALSEPIVNGTLFVVTGSDRAKRWNSAIFPPSEGTLERHTVFKYAEKSSLEREWNETSAVIMSNEESTAAEGNHPCGLFLRGAFVALSKPIWEHGIAPMPLLSVPLYHIPSAPIYGRRANLERYIRRFRRGPGENQDLPSEIVFHPSFVLLQILLDVEPAANVAIVDDSVWSAFMTGQTLILSEFVKLVNNILDNYDIVNEDGIARFSAKNHAELSLKEKIDLYLQFFFTGTTRPKREQKALRKLKRILTKPPPIPREVDSDSGTGFEPSH